MKTIIVFMAALVCVLPISAQGVPLQERVDSCRSVLRSLPPLDSVTPSAARTAVVRLRDHCGYLTNSLGRDLVVAFARREISPEKLDEFSEVSTAAWEVGPKYFERLTPPQPVLGIDTRRTILMQ